MSTWHWLDISGFTPCHLSLGALQGCGEGEEEKRGRIEGPTLMSHFANFLQPTLPSQCYTYSTSPKALNSLLSLNRTNREKHTALSTLCAFDWTFIILVALTWSPSWAFHCDHSVSANYLQREKYKHMSAGPAADNWWISVFPKIYFFLQQDQKRWFLFFVKLLSNIYFSLSCKNLDLSWDLLANTATNYATSSTLEPYVYVSPPCMRICIWFSSSCSLW